jgi:ParB family chromosome partitioning protein
MTNSKTKQNPKITQRAKPSKATSGKKPVSKTASMKPDRPILAQSIQMIPLNKLAMSPKNVRTVEPSEAEDAELLAGIREKGLIQNLAGYEDGKGGYLIDAGGRRLKALKALAEEGVIPKTHPIPCLIEDEAEAITTSTMENAQRAAMHPADQFEAYNQLTKEGRSEDDIALKFGVSVDLVRRRLKLARVAPEIIDQFRLGEINLECVMAFTLSDDHDRQIAIWNSVKDGWQVQPYGIKRMLTETGYCASSKLGQFVGLEAYEAAGGSVMTDLFSDHDNTHLENSELLERLAIKKLQSHAKPYKASWKWVDVHLELDHAALRSFGRVYPQDAEPDQALVEETEALTARMEELDCLNQEDTYSDEALEECRTIEERLDQIQEEVKEARFYRNEDRKIAGVVISIGHQGMLNVEKGLVRPEDIPAVEVSDETEDENTFSGSGPKVTAPMSSIPTPISDPATALRKADGITQSLATDLRSTRQHILRAHLSADYDVAYDTLLYALCEQALSQGNCEALNITIIPFLAPNRDNLHKDTVAEKMLQALKKDLVLDWMVLDAPEDFRAMASLPVEDKQALFAWAVGFALKPQLSNDNHPSPILEEIGSRLEVDVAACWRPTATSYWGQVNKAHAVKLSTDLIGDEFAQERNRERKLDLAVSMERAFAENATETEGFDVAIAARTSRWLPEGMTFEDTQRIEDDLDVSVDRDDLQTAETLPAFMQGGAA